MMLHQNFKQIKLLNGFFVLPARISPKEKRGASGGFLPRPLLLRLRHPNSEKRNQPKFWQILSLENSFAKTSSALFPFHSLGFSAKSLRFLHSEQVSFGGHEESRTPHLFHAMEALYQMSYMPNLRHQNLNKKYKINLLNKILSFNNSS